MDCAKKKYNQRAIVRNYRGYVRKAWKLLFSVEYDRGDAVEGYLIPDGFSEAASVVVSDEGIDIATVACTGLREAVVASGRHGTGLVGFYLDDNVIPNLSGRRTLSIREAKNGLLIYRRPLVKDPVPKRVVRLETHLLPFSKLDRYCGNFFQYELSSMERFGHETVLQAFHLNAMHSVYLSGRLLMRNYEQFLDKGYDGVVLLADPYYEMATRMFLMHKMSINPISFVNERDKIILAPAAQYFADVNLTDPSAIKAALRAAPVKVRQVLISPVTRQLVCSLPEQIPTRSELAAAVDLLSRFTIVSHEESGTQFQEALGEFLGVLSEKLPVRVQHSTLHSIAEVLRSLPIAESMLEQDLILDYYVRKAAAMSLPVNGH